MARPYIQHKEKVSEMERKESDWVNNPGVSSYLSVAVSSLFLTNSMIH